MPELLHHRNSLSTRQLYFVVLGSFKAFPIMGTLSPSKMYALRVSYIFSILEIIMLTTNKILTYTVFLENPTPK